MRRLVAGVATFAILTGAIASALPRGTEQAVSSAPEGGWTWPFTDPRAIHHGGTVYYGYVRGSDGSLVVATMDDTTGAVGETVISSSFEVDDHDAPGLLIRSSDSRIMAFYAKHDDTTVRYKVSTNPLDISSWGSEQTVSNKVGTTFTYPSPVEIGGSIYLFYRSRVSGDAETTVSVTANDGATWATAVRLHDVTYSKLAVDGTKVHVLCSDHPNDAATSIYHFYWDTATGTKHKSDGSTISASLPLQGSDMTKVYDGSTTRAWVWDIALDDAGDPVATFATFPGNDGSDHRAQRAEWTGSAWSVSEVAAMGGTIHPTDYPEGINQDFYSGGIVIDRADTRLSYVSRQNGADWHIYRYPGAVQLTTGSVKHIRPVAVRDPARIRALAMAGTYSTYVDYSVGTIAIPR